MGEWIRNKRRTNGFPLGLEGKKVEARHRDGEIFTGVVGEHHYLSAENFNTADGYDGDVMAYRILEDEPSPPDTDGWIEWHVGDCPVEKGTMVDVKHRCGDIHLNQTALLRAPLPDGCAEDWDNDGVRSDIIAYRLSKPDWPEDRVDVIGQNGNNGEHYSDAGDTSLEHVENDAENVRVDMVNEPPHYKQGGIECIDAIKSALTPEEWRGYCKGNALKYIWRERHKGCDESLQKADWYLNRLNK